MTSHLKSRWTVLLVIVIISTLASYAIDSVSSLEEILKNDFRQTGMVDADFVASYSLLYSGYSLPNIVCPLLAGFFMHRLGLNRLVIFTSLSAVIGQSIIFLGYLSHSFVPMILGRVFVGMGMESLMVGLQTYLSRSFASSEVALAFGAVLSAIRLGSVLNDYLLPWIANLFGIGSAMFSTVFSCFIVFGLSTWLAFWQNKAYPHSKNMASRKNVRPLGTNLFWDLLLVIVAGECCVVPFQQRASSIMNKLIFSHTLDKDQAISASNSAMAIPLIVSGVLTPAFGLAIDKSGSWKNYLGLAALLIFFTFISMGYLNPTLSMIIFGMGYTIFSASSWPSISKTLNADETPVGFGIATSIKFACLTPLTFMLGRLEFENGLNLLCLLAMSMLYLTYRLRACDKEPVKEPLSKPDQMQPDVRVIADSENFIEDQGNYGGVAAHLSSRS